MATKLHSVVGKAMWAKVFEHNKDSNEDFHGPGGACTIDVLLDKEELDKVSKSGSRLKPRITDDGISIKFKRKLVHPSITELGGAPRVVDADEKEWDASQVIGNMSDVEVYFEVYDTKMGPGTRLRAVKVLNLVEFVPEDGGGEAENKLPF